MRVLSIGTDRYTRVCVVDEPGQGGACHVYEIERKELDPSQPLLATINFQKGPIGEHGVNGCHQEDLIAICIDRLKGFQSGEYACRENAIAITKLEESLHWLRHRTNDREKRGVEGTSVI